MLKNLLTVGGWTMISRVLGLVRDQLLAAFLGASPLQDAYQVAFRLPNMFRNLFGEGAFNAAFVPMFTTILTQKDKPTAQRFANEAFSILITILFIITILGEIFMPQLLHIIAPGFLNHGNRYAEAVIFSRITFPYMILICAAALVAGVLNSLHQFGIAAAAYVSFNVVGIAALLWLTPFMPNAAWAASWGITISGVVQFGILWFAAVHSGIFITLHRPKFTVDIRNLFRKMAPGILGSGITQINLTIDTIIATLLPTGSVSLMYFADRINQLPLGVLGAAAGTTLLPLLTKNIASRDIQAAYATQNRAMEYTMLFTIPAAFGIFTLAAPILSTLFGHGAFTVKDVYMSAQSLHAFAIGLPAFVMVKVLMPGFFARGDTTTPVKIGMTTLTLNLILNLILMKPLAHMGPPLASSLAAMMNVIISGTILWRRQALYLPKILILRLGGMIISSIIMSLCIYSVEIFCFPDIPLQNVLFRILAISVLIILGFFIYGFSLHLLGIIKIQQFLGKLQKRFNRK